MIPSRFCPRTANGLSLSGRFQGKTSRLVPESRRRRSFGRFGPMGKMPPYSSAPGRARRRSQCSLILRSRNSPPAAATSSFSAMAGPPRVQFMLLIRPTGRNISFAPGLISRWLERASTAIVFSCGNTATLLAAAATTGFGCCAQMGRR